MDKLESNIQGKKLITNQDVFLYKWKIFDTLNNSEEMLKMKHSFKNATKQEVINRMIEVFDVKDISELIIAIGKQKTSMKYYRWRNEKNNIYWEVGTSSIYKKLLGESRKVETMEEVRAFLNAILDIYPEYKTNNNVCIILSDIDKSIERIVNYRKPKTSSQRKFDYTIYGTTADQNKCRDDATTKDAIQLLEDKLGVDNVIGLIEKIGDFHNTIPKKDNKSDFKYGNRTISEIYKKITWKKWRLKTISEAKELIRIILNFYPEYKENIWVVNSLIALDHKDAWKMASREDAILRIQQALEAEGIVDMIKKINRMRTNLQIYDWKDKAGPKYGKQTRRAVYKKLTWENGRFNNTKEIYKSIQWILQAYPEYRENSIVISILNNLIKKIKKTQGEAIMLDEQF